jgi:hypothetical protein
VLAAKSVKRSAPASRGQLELGEAVVTWAPRPRGRPTIAWVDSVIARGRAKGVPEAELAKQRAELLERHGLEET